MSDMSGKTHRCRAVVVGWMSGKSATCRAVVVGSTLDMSGKTQRCRAVVRSMSVNTMLELLTDKGKIKKYISTIEPIYH